MLEASPAATWSRADPMGSYRPTSSKRDPKAGAHLHFHHLAASLWDRRKRQLFDGAAGAFSNGYGLLGLFYEYCSALVAPPGKFWVAPNAMIEDDGSGAMRRVDPATEGRELLETFEGMSLGSSVALPEELSFYPMDRLESELPGAATFGAPPSGRVLTWKDVEEEYGVVALLDKEAARGVSIVPTKERLTSWELKCKNFPRVPYGPEIIDGLNDRIAGVSPYTAASLVGDGEFGRGWRCRSLLQAMYLMVYLDLTGGNKVRRCPRPDCQMYYRMGAHESEYCSEKCTSWATTRRSRGQ